MATLNGRHEPGDPVTAARDGVQAPVRPVLAGRRGLRQRAGLVAVAVVAITVVAAGIGLGGRGTGPEPSPFGSSTSTDESSPNPVGATSTGPIATPATACVPVGPGDPPEVRLWPTTGEADPVLGVAGPSLASGATLPTQDWPVPTADQALHMDRLGSLVLLVDEGACASRVVAEYLPVPRLDERPAPLGAGEINVDPPRDRIVLRSPPAGDWVVRVEVFLWHGAGGRSVRADLERFFRVTEDGPEVTPYMTPAVPCTPLPIDARPPTLTLRVGDGSPVRGIDPATFPGDMLRNGAIVEGTFPDRVELLVDGDVCATSWSVEFLDYGGGGALGGSALDNPGENPLFASQNRIWLNDALIGTTVVFATVRFGVDRTAYGAWELTLIGPEAPDGEFIGLDGRAVPAARNCGAYWTVAGGVSSSETCPDSALPDDLALLTVRGGDPVRFDIAGWHIQSWTVYCGTRSIEDPGYLDGNVSCDLGSGTEGPAIFLPFVGRTIVMVSVAADRDGDVVNATYVVEIVAEP